MLKKILSNINAKKHKVLTFCIVFAVTAVAISAVNLGNPDIYAEEYHVMGAEISAESRDFSAVQAPEESALPDDYDDKNDSVAEHVIHAAISNTARVLQESGQDVEETFMTAGVSSAKTAQNLTIYATPTKWISSTESLEGFTYLSEIPLSKELQEYTFSLCKENDISYTLVLSLMWRESRFNCNAIGYNSNGTQDSGIMQINDVNKSWLNKELNINNLLDPYQNIQAGVAMLSMFNEKYGEHGALMAYQYGEGGMKTKIAQGVTTNKQIELLYQKQAEFELLVTDANQQKD